MKLREALANTLIIILILAGIVLAAEWDGYRRARDRYDIPPAPPETLTVKADTAAIIQAATAGMVPYDAEGEREKQEALDRARRKLARLNAWLDSLTRADTLGARDTLTDSPLHFPSLTADTVVTWSGEDTLRRTKWNAELQHDQVVIPLLGQIRNSYTLNLDFYYPPAETTYVEGTGNRWTWWEKGAVVLGLWAGWKLRGDLQ